MATKAQQKLCRVRGCRTKWRLASTQLCYKHRNSDLVNVRLPKKPMCCTVDDCPNAVLAYGRCSSHQYALYEQLADETLLELEAIMTEWIAPDSDGCWIWHGRTKDGYGHVIVNGRWITVHRWLYMHLVGPIPNAHEMHHECEKPRCVRPGHLVPLTPEQHQSITAFSKFLFGIVPSGVLAIENWSRTDRERMFARAYELPSDMDATPILALQSM